jgi:hypothetical protein
MAKTIQPSGSVILRSGENGAGLGVREYSVEATSGILGSVIHGLRVELRFRGDTEVSLNLGAADALQLAEELRAAVHAREDVRR